jgi:23S rRNA-/tRNA-specific pseudouridylate synthase
MNAEFQVLELEIPQELAGERLDSALARLLPEHSRTRIKAWIEAGQVQVGRLPSKPRDKVAGGARIRLTIGPWAPIARCSRKRSRSMWSTRTRRCW